MKRNLLFLATLVVALATFAGGISAFAAPVTYTPYVPAFDPPTTAAEWQLEKENIENALFGDLSSCFTDLDFQLEGLLAGIEDQSPARVVEELDGLEPSTIDDTNDVPQQAEECNLLIDQLQDAIEALIDEVGALETGADPDINELNANPNEPIDGGVVSYVQFKITYELSAVQAMLEALAGVKDGMVTALLAVYSGDVDPFVDPTDPYGLAYNCVVFGQLFCDDLLDVTGATGVNNQQQQLNWSLMEEAVNRAIFLKESAEDFFFTGTYFGFSFGALSLQAIFFEINFEVDCLEDTDSSPDCQAWYNAQANTNILNGVGSVAALAVESLSVSNTYATPNPASAESNSQVTFVAEGTGISQVQVEIYDLAGGKVYESGYQQGNALSWNLLSNAGQPVANGVYLYVVTAQGQNGEVARGQVQKLVVLK